MLMPAYCQYEIKKGTVNTLKLGSKLQSSETAWKRMSEDCCYLWLYDDGMYTIELESWWEYFWTADISLVQEAEILHVSAGHYYWDGDKLHCKDIITNSTFDFISSNGSLITVKGLPFMNDCVFSDFSKDAHTFLDLSKAITDVKWQELDKTIARQNQLKNTKYTTHLTEFLVFTIDIRPDNTYDMEYGGLLISQGKWERNGNLLVMHDNNVDGHYYALIGDNELTINILDDGPKTLSVHEDDVDILICPEPEISYIDFPNPDYPIRHDLDDDYHFIFVEEAPEFPGGTTALLDYIRKSIEYPEDALRDNKEGRVLVTFTIEEDGSITNPEVIKSICPSLDAEAVRIVKQMPKWKPGKQRGKTYRVRFTVPVSFRINR